jgi:hypothetical protein
MGEASNHPTLFSGKINLTPYRLSRPRKRFGFQGRKKTPPAVLVGGLFSVQRNNGKKRKTL